jgi:ribonuclease P protein component
MMISPAAILDRCDTEPERAILLGTSGMTEKRATFPKTHRLSGKDSFSAVYDARVREARGPLTVYAKPNALPHARLGLSISRRVGTAPRRNRIKRLLRESFRFLQHDIPRGYDLIVVARPPDARFGGISADSERPDCKAAHGRKSQDKPDRRDMRWLLIHRDSLPRSVNSWAGVPISANVQPVCDRRDQQIRRPRKLADDKRIARCHPGAARDMIRRETPGAPRHLRGRAVGLRIGTERQHACR